MARPIPAVLGAALLAAPVARAQTAPPACSSLPNAVYVQAGDTQEPLLKLIGRRLRDNTPNPVTLVYELAGSCTNIDALYTGVKITTNMSYLPSTAEDPAWTTADPALPCSVPAAGVDVDVGVSATFVDSCDTNAPPSGVKLFTGPLQAYLFVVPEASTQKAITAEEGYFVFGFGDADQVTPWNDETQLFIRPVTKSTLLTAAAAIGVPPAKTKGRQLPASTDVVNAVSTAPDPEAAIGLLGAEVYDKHRDVLNALAFRAFRQRHAYYPDSTATAFDKKNVRDGHYLPWSPTVYIAHVDGSGTIVNPLARYVVDLITRFDATPPPSFDALGTIIEANLIPACAMTVSRSFEGGDLSPYTPPEPCGCYYESKVGAVPGSCTACTADADCSSGKCRHGYCEAR